MTGCSGSAFGRALIAKSFARRGRGTAAVGNTRVLSTQMGDDAFYGPMESALNEFPDLQSVLPNGYPRSRVNNDTALEFEQSRNDRYPHHINLPLVLYLVGKRGERQEARMFSRQVASELDLFARTFASVPRSHGVLAPLWLSPFDADPNLWSVIAHCRIALRLYEVGRPVHGFEVRPGPGNVTADIHSELDGQETFLEIEMWNDLRGDDEQTILSRAKKRCETKALAKFAGMKSEAIGLVVQVAFAQNPEIVIASQNRLLTSFGLDRPPQCTGQLMLIATNGRDGKATGYRMLFENETW